MNQKHCCILLCLFAWAFRQQSFSQNSLQGKVSDAKTHEPLIGAIVFIHDLKTGATTDTNGTFSMLHLPAGKFVIEISYTAYSTKAIQVFIDGAVTKNIELEPSVAELHEVVVTGSSKASEIRRSPVSMISVDQKQMERNLNTNIIDAIAKLPGVSAVTTGPNISKPIIRVLGYYRVLTLYDGIRQEGKQWGDEHGVEVDEYAIDRIEVVKGPASLMYGSDALAGVVNLLPALPVPAGTIKGSVLTNYQSNHGLVALSANVAATNNGFSWQMRLSGKEAGNYQNSSDGRVYGTGYREYDASASMGITKKWGYAYFGFTLYDLTQPIPDGSRDSATRGFTKQISEADTLRQGVSASELNSYDIPRQRQ